MIFLLASYAVTEGASRPQDAAKTGVSISYSLPATELSLHEPILINFKITNETTQVISLDLGQDRKGAFLFTVTSPDGTTIRLPQYRHNGIAQYGNVSVRAGESFSQIQDKISDPRLKETVKRAVERTSERERNEIVRTQIAYLDYRDPNLQQKAIQELMRVEGGLQQAEPALQRLANDPHQPPDVRAAAKDALRTLHPKQP